MLMGVLFNRQNFGGNILAFATPGQGTHVAFPTEFDMFARASHKSVGYGTVGDRELKFVASQTVIIGAGCAKSTLNHFPFVGLEYYSLTLEIVDVAGIDTGAVDEEKAEINEYRQRYKDCD